jgi:hypothetical protein
VIRFGEQVGHGEPDIEGGVAVVDHFVIEEDEAAVVDEDVLGAEVAVDDGEAGGAGFGDEDAEERRGCGDLPAVYS